MQCVENHIRLLFRTNQEIEAWKRTIEKLCCNAIDNGGQRAWRRRRHVEGRALIRLQAEVPARNIKLNAITELIIERYLSNGRVNTDLRLRLVELSDCLFDNTVIFGARVHQQRIGRNIGGNSDSLQGRLAPTGRGTARIVSTSGSAAVSSCGSAAGRCSRSTSQSACCATDSSTETPTRSGRH